MIILIDRRYGSGWQFVFFSQCQDIFWEVSSDGVSASSSETETSSSETKTETET